MTSLFKKPNLTCLINIKYILFNYFNLNTNLQKNIKI